MNKIHGASLVVFKSGCTEHLNSYKQIFTYNFNTNLELIEELFNNKITLEKDMINHYVIEGKFAIGFTLPNGKEYLIDAFNVYSLPTDTAKHFIKEEHLTNIWRDLMLDEYANTAYPLSLRIELENERHQAHADVDAKYNDLINRL